MPFRSRIEDLELQKTLQGGQLPLNKFFYFVVVANLGKSGAPVMMLNVVRTMQLKGLMTHLCHLIHLPYKYQSEIFIYLGDTEWKGNTRTADMA
jgi:hypothetical protein